METDQDIWYYNIDWMVLNNYRSFYNNRIAVVEHLQLEGAVMQL